MLLTLSGRSFIKSKYSSFPLFSLAFPFRIASNVLQYYVKRENEKFKVIFQSGCEAPAINLGKKNMTIGIFTNISRYPTGKHEIKRANHKATQATQCSEMGYALPFPIKRKVKVEFRSTGAIHL